MGALSRLATALAAAALGLAGCTSYESAYEKAVYDYEPIYCYQSLGGVDCYRKANRRDDLRLVNYYGPAPSKYKRHAPAETAELQAPPEGRAAYRDAEPDPGEAMPAGAASPGSSAEQEKEHAGSTSDWKAWLPLLSVGFGALQVVAAFVM